MPLWHPRDATRALAQLPGGGCAAIHGETLELVEPAAETPSEPAKDSPVDISSVPEPAAEVSKAAAEEAEAAEAPAADISSTDSKAESKPAAEKPEAPPAADIESSDAAPAAEKAPEAEKPLDIQGSGRRRRLRGGA